MAAFDFPNPPSPGQEVTNDATGVTYRYDSATQSWVIVSSQSATNIANDVAQLQSDVNTLETLLPLETSARQQGDANLQSQINNLDIPDDFDPTPIYAALETEGRTRQLADENLQSQIDAIEPGSGVNADDYYTKDEIDNQFTLRGVGYTYLLSGISGGVTIRAGEFNTNNRLAGQITFISIAPEDDEGKRRRDAVAGDTIEIYDRISTKYYRYIINSGEDGTYGITYDGGEDVRNDPLSVGSAYLIYLYPTHISSANYYDKDASDDRFMSLKPGEAQEVYRITRFNQTVDYLASVSFPNNIANKRYVDEKFASAATVDYVNSEVDKMILSFSQEDAEPDIFYGDYAPAGTMKNGNIWFDAMNLRLNVWSQGAWINPDRNDGASLENRITALETRIAQLEGN